MDEDTQRRLNAAIRGAWQAKDAQVQVDIRCRDHDKLDVTIISTLFEGRAGAERESLHWSLVRTLPPADLVRMTYALLLTPDEAGRYFPEKKDNA